MADPVIPLDPEMDVLAGELALGLLEGSERLEAERLRLEDPAFAAAVERWQAQGLAWSDEQPDEAPSEAMWARIQASVTRRPVEVAVAGPPADLDAAPVARTAAPVTVRDAGPWKPAAIAASLAALMFAGLLAFRSPQIVEVPVEVPAEQALATEALSVAQINGAEDGMLLSALYDRETGRLYLRLADIPDPDRVPQLWLIDDTGTPRSLGFGTRGAVSELALTPEQQAIIESAGTIAVSLEAPAAVPGDTPTDVLGAANLAPFDQS